MSTTRLAIKYRLYPTASQESVLRRMLSTCSAIYNSLLHWRKHDYERYGTSPDYYEQKKAITAWKPAHPELSEVHSHMLQDVCKRVNLAFFRSILTYKAESAGRLLITVNPAYTSQDCSGGGNGWLTIESFGPSLPDLAAMCIWRDPFESEMPLAQQGLRFMRQRFQG